MKTMSIALGLIVFASSPLAAQETVTVGADNRTDLSITIYNNDLALVRDTRRAALDDGRYHLELSDLAKRIEPETLVFSADGIKTLERNFDFDLLTPQSILENAVGQTVRIYRTHPRTGEDMAEDAKVLSTNNGVILEIDGRIEILDMMPGRVVFDHLPPGLRTDPALSMLVDVDAQGAKDMELTYFTGGLSWQADYVGVLNGDYDRMDLTGWVTLTNHSGTDFSNVSTQLVAGDVNRNRFQIVARQTAAPNRVYAEMAKDSVSRESLMAYHLYTLPERTGIKDRQTKQVHLMDTPDTAVKRVYRYDAAGFSSLDAPRPVDIFLYFDNDKATGPGLPLPAGTVRLYAADSAGRLQFVGEDNVRHLPVGGKAELMAGQAFDITVKPEAIERTLVEKSRDRQVVDITQRYSFENAQDDAVTVSLSQNIPDANWTLLQESQPHDEKGADRLTWTVDVPAKGSATLQFQVRLVH